MNDDTPKPIGTTARSTAQVFGYDHRDGYFLQIVLQNDFSVLLRVPKNDDPPSCTIQHTDGVVDLEQYQGEVARFQEFVEIALGPR